ncbi:hypothetical protein Pcinc_042047 [Petrolisthes cinctipes]|uniref:Uncharacterized protein n=1 Tax=Petrolisthes cinctipes TaxID=88211 RepID=A0AAE1BIP5_PETCI|nr:hypothetical protein Pcinc_042047 [Petrolisthes cinctipes]
MYKKNGKGKKERCDGGEEGKEGEEISEEKGEKKRKIFLRTSGASLPSSSVTGRVGWVWVEVGVEVVVEAAAVMVEVVVAEAAVVVVVVVVEEGMAGSPVAASPPLWPQQRHLMGEEGYKKVQC